ncbi:MAG: coproporphyrinogen III oxidase, partial [Clostridia bacterium]|nr:coproporphyrinogen III oxidase [Clostridia bacterium]
GKLSLPSEDDVVALYNLTIASLSGYGFSQYEISNFSKPGFESRHNLKYWNDEEYLGVGPAAHSFIDVKRFYYPSDIEGFISGSASIVDDGEGGSFEERLMLALRLNTGFCGEMPDEFFERVKREAEGSLSGYVEVGPNSIRLTKEGFLVSNTVIGKILDLI